MEYAKSPHATAKPQQKPDWRGRIAERRRKTTQARHHSRRAKARHNSKRSHQITTEMVASERLRNTVAREKATQFIGNVPGKLGGGSRVLRSVATQAWSSPMFVQKINNLPGQEADHRRGLFGLNLYTPNTPLLFTSN